MRFGPRSFLFLPLLLLPFLLSTPAGAQTWYVNDTATFGDLDLDVDFDDLARLAAITARQPAPPATRPTPTTTGRSAHRA